MLKSVKLYSKYFQVRSLALAILIGFPTQTFADFPLSDIYTYGDRVWEISSGANIFQTNANYSKAGNSYDNLANGNSFRLLNLDFNTKIGLSSLWNFSAGARIGVSESKDLTQTRSNSQFNRLVFGSDLLVWNQKLKVIADMKLIMPLVRSENSSDAVQTSEGATEAFGRMILRTDIGDWTLATSMGYNYRDEGRSGQLIYTLTSEYLFSASALGGSISGSTSILEDTNTNKPENREAVAFNVNAKSAIFNSVNPELLEANGWYRYLGKDFGLQFGLGSTLNGKNSAQGQQVFAIWSYRFKVPPATSEPAVKPELQRFKEDIKNDVDQVLFKPEKPAPPPTPEPPKPDARKQLQNDLDRTEMQIELKRLKKKKKPN